MAKFYVPGEVIPATALPNVKIIGYGLDKSSEGFTVSQPGVLQTDDKQQAWINVHSKRYIPQTGDHVIGVVTNKQGDLYKVDIGSADLAYISYLSFEGATKRNRPTIAIGDLLFARVHRASRHLEPELICVDDELKARGLGSLEGGFSFKISTNHARRLLHPQSRLFKLIGEAFKFEVALGINGRVWIKAADYKQMSQIHSIISQSEFVLERDLPQFLHDSLKSPEDRETRLEGESTTMQTIINVETQTNVKMEIVEEKEAGEIED